MTLATAQHKIADARSPLYISGLGRGFAELRNLDPNEEGISTDTMLTRAGLDWDVEQLPVSYGKSREAEGYVANARSDNGNLLGIVGSTYEPLSNRDGFAFADNIVQSGSGGWMTARELNGGSTVVALMKLNRDIKIGGLDSERVMPLIAFRNSHDGSGSVSVRMTPMRLACLNGMLLPVKGSVREWKARHTRSLTGRIEDARRALEISFTYYDELEELGNKLVAKKVNDRAFAKFLDRLIPYTPTMEEDPGGRPARNREQAINAITGYYNGENLGNVKGTAWGALQAVGEFADWERPVRNTGRSTADENRFVRVTQVSPIKDRALELLTA